MRGRARRGARRVARLAAEAVALVLGAVAPPLAGPPLVVVLIALAASGHAAAAAPAWLGIAADALHLLTAALWAGGILALATLRPPGGWRGGEARRLLERFSPVALAAFGLTVAFGAVRAFQELADPGDLVSTPYGLVLNAKVLLVLAMLPLSLAAWRRRAAAPRLEAALAVAVVGAAALLAAFPLPPARLGEAEAARAAPSAAAAAPGPGDLTLGAAAGDAIVGLTLRPGAPGPNQALVYVIPLEGEAAAEGLPVEIAVGERVLATRPCGPACRAAELDLRGGERLAVRVAGPKGGTAAFDLPDLPAPDGTDLLRRAQARMHALRTYKVDEALGPRQPPYRTSYAFQAPDRAAITGESGLEIVWIGRDRYQRDGPEQPWRVETFDAGLGVPGYLWDGPGGPGTVSYVAPRVAGTAFVDGVDARVLTFFAYLGKLPAWFRFWVDADGLVHRVEMRAQGHVMDQRYHDLDAPLAVERPGAATPVATGPAAAQGASASPGGATGGAAPATAPLAGAAPGSALPRPDDLTLGGSAGQVLVALTLRPGTPGENTALVYLLPPDRESPTLPAELRTGGRGMGLTPSASTCRTGRLELRGGERLEVVVPDSPGTRGGTAVFDLPALPAPDSADLLDRAQRRMHALRTYRVDEWLGPADLPGRPRIFSTLTYQAPDRMRLEVDNGFQRVWVGDTRYARDRPSDAWQVEGVGSRLPVPRFDWDPAESQVVAPRLVGGETVDGVATRVMSFYLPLGHSPAWFRLWLDGDGLVRQAQMRTGGEHFMDQRYHGFDAPFAVERPLP